MNKKNSKGCVVYLKVHLGKKTILHAPCIIGIPPRGKKPGELATFIGEQAVIRPFSSIYAGTRIGKFFQSGHGVFIREDNIIGDEVSIGTYAVLEYGNRIGNNVRIHSGCFLESVTVEDNVFIGPHVTFLDDRHPPCPKYKECEGGVLVKTGANIGGNSTILPGVIIGKNALVGGGSVVTKNVPDGMVVAGNPARILKSVDELKCIKGFYKRPYIWDRKKGD